MPDQYRDRIVIDTDNSIKVLIGDLTDSFLADASVARVFDNKVLDQDLARSVIVGIVAILSPAIRF